MKSSERIYLHTSCYLSVLLGETGSAAILKELHKKIFCSSTLLLIEAERNLVRLSREQILSISDYQLAMNQLREDQQKFLLRDFTLDLALTGVFPPARLPRSCDLAHLRTALWFQKNGGIASFITCDIKQKQAAEDFGLPVWNPS
ncbi:MAG: hypothetical protein JNK65_02375 [Deltaproteobacteria bacterium]|nr:hypothetical protein [Deltaproteobacteria bacterium]